MGNTGKPRNPWSGPDRRTKKRVHPGQLVVVRFGTIGAVVVDLSEGGVRLEHYARVESGRKSRVRFDWEGRTASVAVEVLASKIARFIPGDDGVTIYESRLRFVDPDDEALQLIREIVSAYVARGLAEQVANAKGLGPILAKDMPVFRLGVVSDNDGNGAGKDEYLLPRAEIVKHKGYIRCRLMNNTWEEKWTSRPKQPRDGFTVLASEPSDQIQLLRDTYLEADREGRRFIRAIARASVKESVDEEESADI